MALTQLQKELIHLMKKAGVVVECCETVIGHLEAEEEQQQMLEFLLANPTATNRQVAMKTKELIEKRKR